MTHTINPNQKPSDDEILWRAVETHNSIKDDTEFAVTLIQEVPRYWKEKNFIEIEGFPNEN